MGYLFSYQFQKIRGFKIWFFKRDKPLIHHNTPFWWRMYISGYDFESNNVEQKLSTGTYLILNILQSMQFRSNLGKWHQSTTYTTIFYDYYPTIAIIKFWPVSDKLSNARRSISRSVSCLPVLALLYTQEVPSIYLPTMASVLCARSWKVPYSYTNYILPASKLKLVKYIQPRLLTVESISILQTNNTIMEEEDNR